ncbi:response regulator transcription factor [Clostridium massiliamazoniense]|uniref:response regulator transcription factor n=1 Tax=Clostridium massiliamazoniense TaxID=1347366 RepID=UPI0006D8332A|nr:response regulator [Clostridium massiliamazoniense]
MRKVMLVDDEIFITEGLRNIIDWEALGLEVVQSTENGEEALRKFNESPVDIIVTDINMPNKTGLELVKELKDTGHNVKFIILSGYDEFSYAKKAIEYGVENYILKPIDEEELEEALKKLVDNMNKEKTIINKGLDKTGKLLAFLNGKYDLKEIIGIKNDMYVDFYKENYTVSNIFINSKKDKNLYINIDNLVENIFEGQYEVLYQFDGQIIIINSWSKDFTDNDILNSYNKLREKLLDNLDYDFFISIGSRVNIIDDLKESYFTAKELKKYMLTEGTNIVFNKTMVSNMEYKELNFNQEIDEINKFIIEKDKEKLKAHIEFIFDNKNLTPKNIYDLSIKIILLVDKILDEFKVGKKYTRESLSETIIELCNESTRESVKAFIISEMDELMAVMYSNTVKYSPVVQQIVNIVNKRYYEDLSLKTLANQYNINSSYLGQIFNKEVGCSFSDYLNKTKNLKAKELILETNMKINDIAKEVGYMDSSYFYRKFKKFFGVSPSTLRDMKNY